MSNMNTNWGGKENKIRLMEIGHEKGFLSSNSPIHKMGGIQQTVFQESDEGPFYMNEISKESCWHDEVYSEKINIKNRLKTDLCEDLERLRINTRGKTIKEVQQMAESRNIPIKVEGDDINEGWVGEPKGLWQVLWEHGLLVPMKTYISNQKRNDPNFKGKVEYV